MQYFLRPQVAYKSETCIILLFCKSLLQCMPSIYLLYNALSTQWGGLLYEVTAIQTALILAGRFTVQRHGYTNSLNYSGAVYCTRT